MLHLSTEELQSRYCEAKDPVERSHYQIVWLIAQGKTTGEVMEATGYSRGWIQQLSRRYNGEGPRALGDLRHRNPGATDRALLTQEQQRELSEALKGPPSDGGMWNSRKVAEWIEKKTGKRGIRAQRGWEYLKKLGYTPKVPRPHHAKVDPAEQEAFKKVSPGR
jgi:transposase